MRKYLLAALMAVAMVMAIAPAASVAKKHTTSCPPGTDVAAYCVCPPGTDNAAYCVCPPGTTDTGDTSDGGGGTRDADDPPGCVCVSGKHECVCPPGTNNAAYCVKKKSNEHGRRND